MLCYWLMQIFRPKVAAEAFEVSRPIVFNDLISGHNTDLASKLASDAFRSAWTAILGAEAYDSPLRTVAHPAQAATRAVILYQDEVAQALAVEPGNPENTALDASKAYRLRRSLHKLTRRSRPLHVWVQDPELHDSIGGGKRIVLPLAGEEGWDENFRCIQRERTDYIDAAMRTTEWQPTTLGDRPLAIPVAELPPKLDVEHVQFLLAAVTQGLASADHEAAVNADLRAKSKPGDEVIPAYLPRRCILNQSEIFTWSPAQPTALPPRPEITS